MCVAFLTRIELPQRPSTTVMVSHLQSRPVGELGYYRSLAALGPGRSPSPPASDGRDQPDTRYLIEWVTALCVAAYCLKVKNPIAPAVKREAEEDWGRSAERRE